MSLDITYSFQNFNGAAAKKIRTTFSGKGIIILLRLFSASHSTDTEARAGLIPGLCRASERRRYKVTPFLIGWAQT